MNLDSRDRPCYEGDDYTDQEYLRMGEILKEKFHCTSPSIPKHLRHGLHICTDEKIGEKVTDFMRSNMAYLNAKMWRSDYYFMPPCTFYEFSLYEMFNEPG